MAKPLYKKCALRFQLPAQSISILVVVRKDTLLYFNDTVWAKRGFVVAHEQFVEGQYAFPQSFGDLSTNGFTSPLLSGATSHGKVKAVKVKHTAHGVTILTRHGQVEIDSTGAITQITAHGKQWLIAPLEPHFWKPENDNQHAAKFAQRLAIWQSAAEERQLQDFHVSQHKDVALTAPPSPISIFCSINLSVMSP